MQIREERRNHDVIATIAGRLDVIASAEMETRLLALIGADTRILVLEVSQLEYVSSAGLRVLMVIAKKIRAQAGDMLFAGADPNVRKILDISGFGKMFKMVATPDEAFANA